MKKRKLACLLAATLFTGSLVGCSGSDDNTQTNVDYKITRMETENGTYRLVADDENTNRLNIVTTPDDGYILDRIYFTYDNDVNKIEYEIQDSFIKPVGDISLYVVFKKDVNFKSVQIAQTSNGKISVNNENPVAGQNVTITATPDTGYRLSNLYYIKDNSNEATKITGGQFTMPDAKVTIYAEFSVYYGTYIFSDMIVTGNTDPDLTIEQDSDFFYLTLGDVVTVTSVSTFEDELIYAVNQYSYTLNNDTFIVPGLGMDLKLTSDGLDAIFSINEVSITQKFKYVADIEFAKGEYCLNDDDDTSTYFNKINDSKIEMYGRNNITGSKTKDSILADMSINGNILTISYND